MHVPERKGPIPSPGLTAENIYGSICRTFLPGWKIGKIKVYGKETSMASGYIVLKRAFLKSEVWRSLTASSMVIYLDLRMRIKVTPSKPKQGRKKEWIPTNDRELVYTYAEAEKRGMPRATFMRAVDELVEKGLIDITHSGSGGKRGDVNLYGISDRWKAWRTKEFVILLRDKDLRLGRGFKRGDAHWRRKVSSIKNDNPKGPEETNMGIKNDNPKAVSIIKNDTSNGDEEPLNYQKWILKHKGKKT